MIYCFQNTSGDWFKSLCVRHLFLAITGAAILVTRWRVMGSAPPVFQVFDNPHSFVNGTLLRVSEYLNPLILNVVGYSFIFSVSVKFCIKGL